MDGHIIGVHSSGPDDASVTATMGGEICHEGGHTTRVGGRRREISLRKHVETASLTTWEAYSFERRDGLRANVYEQGVSIWAIKDSLKEWGILATEAPAPQ